jgi:tetratricopeptide (TPR) repeat protein
MKLKKILLGVFVLALIAGAGYYLWHYLKKPQPEQAQQLEPPNLDRPINITADLPEDAKKIDREKIEELTTALKKNLDFGENWLLLGVYRKTIGDYEGARECWEYVVFLNPQNSIAFNNLGDLYANYLKDNKKAEENFLKAIEISPSQIYIYRSLYDFYYYVEKDTAKAKQLLEQGIAANPSSSQDLKILLDELNKKK